MKGKMTMSRYFGLLYGELQKDRYDVTLSRRLFSDFWKLLIIIIGFQTSAGYIFGPVWYMLLIVWYWYMACFDVIVPTIMRNSEVYKYKRKKLGKGKKERTEAKEKGTARKS